MTKLADRQVLVPRTSSLCRVYAASAWFHTEGNFIMKKTVGPIYSNVVRTIGDRAFAA